MKRTRFGFLALTVIAILSIMGALYAQTSDSAAAPPAAQSAQAAPQTAPDPGWPRQMTAEGYSLTIHQPQVDKWNEYKELTFRAALEVKRKGHDKSDIGVLEGTAPTEVDGAERTVKLSGMKYTVRFPGAAEGDAAELEKVVRGFLPGTRVMTVSLDRILTYLEPDSAPVQNDAKVSIEPPQIFYTTKPAILVIFQGEPQFQPVVESDPSLLFSINTNWDVFKSTKDSKYYLLEDKSWLVSSDPTAGPWAAAGTLPDGLKNLPNDENWAETKKNIPGVHATTIPDVFVTTVPAELIVTDGPPKLRQIPGTPIMQVSNTPTLLFLYGPNQSYYFLVAGRWFRGDTLSGPWSAATDNLPQDFASIPADDPAAEVLTSVKGTVEAKDAVMLASVPQTEEISLADAKPLKVEYDGAPDFTAIEGTEVQTAINTPTNVFQVTGKYYCCTDGVWYTAPAATGPWTLCVEVPTQIYSIPPTSPKYNVTYVKVYNSTPKTVTYGYTAGYTGGYVYNGLLMFGAGMALGYYLGNNNNNYYKYKYRYPYPIPFYSYGCAAHYNYYRGGFYRAAYGYGPYGGAGRYAGYNPATGRYYRGAAIYGPYGSASARQSYNPWTDRYAAQGRVNTPYGSAGRFYTSQGNKATWGGSRSGPNGTVGWAQNNQGGKGAAWDTNRGQGVVVKNGQGDMVVGKDGNVYKRSDGNWEKYDNGGWQDTGRNSNTKPAYNKNTSTYGSQADNRNQFINNRGQASTLPANGNNNNRPSTLPANANANRDQFANRANQFQTNNTAQTRPAVTSRPTSPATGAAAIQNRQPAATTRPSTPVSRPSTGGGLDSSTYDNLNRQASARDRGNINTSNYQKSNAAAARISTPNYSRPASSSSIQRPSTNPSGGARSGGGGGGRR